MRLAKNCSRRVLPLAIALSLGTVGAEASTIVVTTPGDSGTGSSCTLRQAIGSANNDDASGSSCVAGSGDDTITFAGNITAPIVLSGGQLLIASNVTIAGSGQTINGGGQSRVFYAYSSHNVYLSNLTITGGNADKGAGILFDYDDSSGNSAKRRHAPANKPSAPYTLSLTDVTVTNNTSTFDGAGITFFGQNGGILEIDRSTISGNTVNATENYASGGLYVNGAIASITNSTISGNRATGSDAYVTGGIYAYNTYLYATNTTVAGNSASGTSDIAGGVSFSSNAQGNKYGFFADSTITGNNAVGTSGAIVGGVLIGGYSYGNLGAANTIIAGNTGGAPNAVVVTGAFHPASDLLGTELQATYQGNGNVFSASPGLGPLANNGGPTRTVALLAGSPAIDAGDNALIPQGATDDQRGAGFNRIVNTTVDIGAFEVQGAVVAATTTVPTLSTWTSTLLAGALAAFGFFAIRRRSARAKS